MDGVEILRQIKNKWPETRVIIITAHGTIEIAVEAMKLGAVDFIRKPFSPKEIRELVNRVLKCEELNEATAVNYQDLIEFTRRYMNDGNIKAARESARKAIALDPGKPDAYNLLGGLLEAGRERLEAQKFYRAALDIDPTYKPASDNLERVTSWQRYGKINFGLDIEKSPSKDDNN